ncbi:MAG: hypothetical protein ABID54_12350 [Pseudomonadota bacterium]
MSVYGEREDAVRPALQIAMPRLPRLYAPEGTMHVVARCNNRVEFGGRSCRNCFAFWKARGSQNKGNKGRLEEWNDGSMQGTGSRKQDTGYRRKE